MDIQVSSNFERLLFELYDREGAGRRQLMASLKTEGAYALSQGALERLRAEFDSAAPPRTRPARPSAACSPGPVR
jgi:threonine synthase